MSSSVELRDVSVGSILRNVSLRVAPGESVALIGRSGAGKTTMLRLINGTLNGIVKPTGGAVLVDDADLAHADLIALRRRTGMIIQGSGLFPHRTVYENIATVPRLRCHSMNSKTGCRARCQAASSSASASRAR